MMKEALSTSETSVLTRATRRNIPEDTVLSYRRENLKSYIVFSSYLEFRAMDKLEDRSDSECYTSSTEPFRSCKIVFFSEI
jgi:uncharacterized metal-binding protein